MTITVIDQVQRLAAFTKDGAGGNPAGVWLGDALPDTPVMQRVAAQVGYSETVFATLQNDKWRARYFSPQSEVPFCGHATIALGAALAGAHGDGTFALRLNEANISVEGRATVTGFEASLQSPPTRHAPLGAEAISDAFNLVGLAEADIDRAISPAFVRAGADHMLIALNSADALSNAAYDLEEGRSFMAAHGIVTLALIHRTQDRHFSARNLFASGGVYEDPATGAAAAALAGYLRDTGRLEAGRIEIIQGEAMGQPCLIQAEVTAQSGSSVRVSGAVSEIA